MSLVINNLHAQIPDREILKGLTLTINPGEVHAIMGPNGSGKSTLSKVLCGHEDYAVTSGTVSMDGEDLLGMSVDARSRAGLFLAFQYPHEIPGVSNANFIRAALKARLGKDEDLDAVAFYKQLYTRMDQLEMDRSFTSRSVNEGFSGGEKKRNEILQLMMLEPKYSILDETDSGLDDRRPQDLRSRRQRHAQREPRLPRHHSLPAPARLHPARHRSRHDGRPHRHDRGKDLALELEAKGYDWVPTDGRALAA